MFQVTSVKFATGRGNLLLTNSKDSTLKVSQSYQMLRAALFPLPPVKSIGLNNTIDR